MKHSARILSLLILVSAGLFFANCGGGDDPKPSEESTQLDKFKFTWNISSAGDPADRTDEYTGMTTTFSGTFSDGGTYNYTSTAPTPGWTNPSPWKKEGTWKFKAGAVANKIVRDDGQEMTYSFSGDGKTLTLSFDYSGTGFNNGRVSSVAGAWTFVFTRP